MDWNFIIIVENRCINLIFIPMKLTKHCISKKSEEIWFHSSHYIKFASLSIWRTRYDEWKQHFVVPLFENEIQRHSQFCMWQHWSKLFRKFSTTTTTATKAQLFLSPWVQFHLNEIKNDGNWIQNWTVSTTTLSGTIHFYHHSEFNSLTL